MNRCFLLFLLLIFLISCSPAENFDTSSSQLEEKNETILDLEVLECGPDSLNCCGNDICDSGESRFSCLDCGNSLELESVFDLINEHYDRNDRFEKNKLRAQNKHYRDALDLHLESGLYNRSDYAYYDNPYVVVIQILNQSEYVASKEDFYDWFKSYYSFRFNLEAGDQFESSNYSFSINKIENSYSHQGEMLYEYGRWGFIYKKVHGNEYFVEKIVDAYGSVLIYVPCSSEIILEVSSDTQNYVGLDAFENFSEEELTQMLKEQLEIWRDSALLDAQDLHSACISATR